MQAINAKKGNECRLALVFAGLRLQNLDCLVPRVRLARHSLYPDLYLVYPMVEME